MFAESTEAIRADDVTYADANDREATHERACNVACFTRQVDTETRFTRVREVLVRKYRNANMSPGRHASYLRLRCLKATWAVEAVQAELEALTPDAVRVSWAARAPLFWLNGFLQGQGATRCTSPALPKGQPGPSMPPPGSAGGAGAGRSADEPCECSNEGS